MNPASSRTVSLGQVIVDESVFPRDKLDDERVELFADLYREASGVSDPSKGWTSPLPALVTVADGRGGSILADGRHRYEALQAAGLDLTPIFEHSTPDGMTPLTRAYELALQHCTQSAQPLTEREKRRAVLTLLRDRSELTDTAIARLVGVNQVTVGRIRARAHEFHNVDEPERRPKRPASERLAGQAATISRTLDQLDDEHGRGTEGAQLAMLDACGGDLEALGLLCDRLAWLVDPEEYDPDDDPDWQPADDDDEPEPQAPDEDLARGPVRAAEPQIAPAAPLRTAHAPQVAAPRNWAERALARQSGGV
jgi:hypothetical protein